MAETSADAVKRYVESAVCMEDTFETQLQDLASEEDNDAVKSLLREHASETRKQRERLTTHLQALGGSSSSAKNFLVHLFGATSKAARTHRTKEERTTQNLLIAYAAENSEVAMYESLATMAEAAGDDETVSLARSIQAEEKKMAERLWLLLPSAAGAPAVTEESTRRGANIEGT